MSNSKNLKNKRKTKRKNKNTKGGEVQRIDNSKKNIDFERHMRDYFNNYGTAKQRWVRGQLKLPNNMRYESPDINSKMVDLPDFNPTLWNNYPELHANAGRRVQASHNCFTYGLNLQQEKTKKVCDDRLLDKKNKYKSCGKPQPGNAFGLPRVEGYEGYTCPNLHTKQSIENPYIFPVKEAEECPKGHYKIALVVTDKPGNNGTYHYYREGKQGNKILWDHKDGGRPATNKDASGKLIPMLSKADRDYTKEGGVNYNRICNYYCVPSSDKHKTMDIFIKGSNSQGGKKTKKNKNNKKKKYTRRS